MENIRMKSNIMAKSGMTLYCAECDRTLEIFEYTEKPTLLEIVRIAEIHMRENGHAVG